MPFDIVCIGTGKIYLEKFISELISSFPKLYRLNNF